MWLEISAFNKGPVRSFRLPWVLAMTHSYDWPAWWTCSRKLPPSRPPIVHKEPLVSRQWAQLGSMQDGVLTAGAGLAWSQLRSGLWLG